MPFFKVETSTMISLQRSNLAASRLFAFCGAVAIIGIAGCDSPVAPTSLQTGTNSPAISANFSKSQSAAGCDGRGDSDDRDDRDGGCRCTAAYTNSASFNGSSIAAGNTIWFSAVVRVSGVPRSGATIKVSGQTIQFTANKTNYSIPVPDGSVVFSPSATVAATVFDAGSGSWITTVPMSQSGDRDDDRGGSFDGNVFLAGVSFPVVVALPGGIKPASWSASFSSTVPGLSLDWQWGAAVYTRFDGNAAIGVKPVDGSRLNAYQNSDNAGTPEREKAALLSRGGATGSGGSNYTGALSDVVSIDVCSVKTADVVVAPPLKLNGAATTTIASGVAGTFDATLANNSGVAMPIACAVTIDGTPVSGSGVTVANTGNIDPGATTTCAFKATLTATNGQNTNHTVVVTAEPPAGYSESDPAQSLTTTIVAVPATAPKSSADVIVVPGSLTMQIGSGAPVAVTSTTTITSGTPASFVATLKNSSTSAMTIGCSVKIDGTAVSPASVTVANTGTVAVNGTTTCTFPALLTATGSSTAHTIVITAMPPAGATETDPNQNYTATVTATAPTLQGDVVVASIQPQPNTPALGS
ncbi:MAG TPA: hypothetical protein VMH39_12470, partial [Gemmatimonadaceae bacterium]|nr:hypothetical protein [Gemmatimonadaceae bacterium]